MKREIDICHNCDELSRCYSMIDNLRDDIQELKQELALETAALHDATKELAKYKRQANILELEKPLKLKTVGEIETEMAKKIFADMDELLWEVSASYPPSLCCSIEAYETEKKKYGVEAKTNE